MNEIATLITLAHAASTWALVGLIWIVQLVHYPLMATVSTPQFPSYHAAHTRRITWVVAPLMLAELATAGLLVWLGERNPWWLLSLPLLAANWISTAFVQIPLHNRLARGFDRSAHARLVHTNWTRTAAWSLRGLLLLPALA